MLIHNLVRGPKGRPGSKNQLQDTRSPRLGDASLLRIGTIPALLAPALGQAMLLPLERYQMQLTSIFSAAVIQHAEGSTRYLVPLQDGVTINHPDDLFQSDDFTCSILDQRTIVTFDDTFGLHPPTYTH